jgi:UDP-N-acetylglucosamine acyltransferase
MATVIHPTAIVEPGAQLGTDCEIMAHAVVTRHCTLGDRVVVHPFAVLGGDPQYLKFDRTTPSGVRIGSGSVVREHVTINRSIHAGQATVVGENCFFMAASHAGHDCVVGSGVVLANAALLAGHVSVGDNTFMGGGSAVHQFCRIGESVMVAGHASITRDVAPYVMVAERDDVIGLNNAFHAVFFTPGNIRELAAAELAAGRWTAVEAQRFLGFFAGGKRGFARARRAAAEGEETE